jgi:hypothetical protein
LQLSGVGKTDLTSEVIRKLQADKEVKVPILVTLIKLTQDDEDGDKKNGYGFLVKNVIKQHLNNNDLLLQLPRTKSTLKQLLSAWPHFKTGQSKGVIQRLWIIKLDEYQTAPQKTSSILSAISEWNHPDYVDDEEMCTIVPGLRTLIVPLLSGTSSLDTRNIDYGAPTLYSPIRYTLEEKTTKQVQVRVVLLSQLILLGF